MHIIKLRAAWDRSVHSNASVVNQRVNLPDQPIALEVGGFARYTRSFNCPTGIHDNTSIRLALSAWEGLLTLSLDEQSLCDRKRPSPRGGSWDLTGYLRNSHRIQLRLEPDSPPGSAEVRLCDYFTLQISED